MPTPIELCPNCGSIPLSNNAIHSPMVICRCGLQMVGAQYGISAVEKWNRFAKQAAEDREVGRRSVEAALAARTLTLGGGVRRSL